MMTVGRVSLLKETRLEISIVWTSVPTPVDEEGYGAVSEFVWRDNNVEFVMGFEAAFIMMMIIFGPLPGYRGKQN